MSDFARHVRLHRKRVRVLAAFADPLVVTKWQGRALLALHDVGKYLLLRPLWSYYAGKGDRVAARALYDELNRLDDAIAAPIRLLTPAAFAERVAAAERVADCVDRNCDPVALEEFAREKQPPLSDFLDGRRLETATRLVPDYPAIVKKFRLAYEPSPTRNE